MPVSRGWPRGGRLWVCCATRRGMRLTPSCLPRCPLHLSHPTPSIPPAASMCCLAWITCHRRYSVAAVMSTFRWRLGEPAGMVGRGGGPHFLSPTVSCPPCPGQHFEDGGAFCYWCQDAQDLPKVPIAEWGCSPRVLLSDTRILVSGSGGVRGGLRVEPPSMYPRSWHCEAGLIYWVTGASPLCTR